MATWAEHLRANGASAEEVTLLDTAPARKAWDKAQADAQAAVAAENAKSKADMEAYLATMNDWYETKVMPEWDDYKAKAVTAQAEAARAKAVIAAAAQTNEGLKKIAMDMGWPVDGALAVTPPKTNEPPAIDTSKYFTKDEVVSALTREADVIMLTQDIAAEHASLFPGQRLNFRELGNEARAKKKDLQSYWEEKYKVPDARKAQAEAADKARLDAVRKEERERVETEMASRYGNPMTRPPMPSDSPFAKIIPRDGNKQPWEKQDLHGDRIKQVAENIVKKANAAN